MKKQMFKKLSAILAVAMIIAAIAPLSAQAVGETFIVDNFEYEVKKDASGTNGEVWVNEYKATGGEVVIPDTVASGSNIYTVTGINSAVFEYKSITSVYIPSTIEQIGGDAFKDCASLTNVTFEPGSKLKYIWGRAFYGCKSLKSIDLPDVDDINGYIFYGCSSMNEIIFNSSTPPSITDHLFDSVPSTGKIYYPESSPGYTEDFFNSLFENGFPSKWKKIEGRPPVPVPPTSSGDIITPVNMSADVPEADVPSFGREVSVSGEITNAPGVPESVKLRVSSPRPEFTSNKAANAAYSDAILHGQPVTFNALEIVDAVSGQAYALPEGAKAQLKFELGKAYADKALTISQYDAAGKLIERFNVTCDGDGAAVINASGLGLFVITREWL